MNIFLSGSVEADTRQSPNVPNPWEYRARSWTGVITGTGKARQDWSRSSARPAQEPILASGSGLRWDCRPSGHRWHECTMRQERLSRSPFTFYIKPTHDRASVDSGAHVPGESVSGGALPGETNHQCGQTGLWLQAQANRAQEPLSWKFNMSRFINNDPFQKWNSEPEASNDPFKAWNDPMFEQDPFAPWNNPLGDKRDYERWCDQNHIPEREQ